MFVFPNTFLVFSYYFLELVLSIDNIVFMTKLPFHVGWYLLKSSETRLFKLRRKVFDHSSSKKLFARFVIFVDWICKVVVQRGYVLYL